MSVLFGFAGLFGVWLFGDVLVGLGCASVVGCVVSACWGLLFAVLICYVMLALWLFD